MSAQTDADFEAAHDVLFAVFGEPAQIQRGLGESVSLRVVITYGVAELGDYGQGVNRVTTVKLRNRQWRARAGDRLQLLSGSYRIERIVVDDGVVTEAVLCG